jgi:hypothetical protein
MVGSSLGADGTAVLNRDLDLDRQEMRADLKEAYERGRKDERASRRHHPVLMGLTLVAALAGVIILGLAALNGSFAAAGAAVDQNLHVVVNRAAPQVRGAAAEAGQSLHDAGVAAKAKITSPAG